jgi:hypothetical protein
MTKPIAAFLFGSIAAFFRARRPIGATNLLSRPGNLTWGHPLRHISGAAGRHPRCQRLNAKAATFHVRKTFGQFSKEFFALASHGHGMIEVDDHDALFGGLFENRIEGRFGGGSHVGLWVK